MATAAPNPRASLLSGLRTGGVRSASGSMAVPHTAAPAGSFNIPRVMSTSLARSHFPEEDEMGDGPAQHLSVAPQRYAAPKTAALDNMNNRFTQQQAVAQPVMAGGLPFSPAFGGSPQAQAQAQAQAQIMQMQIQMEMMRLQAIQAQQLQAQAQMNVQNGQRRMGFNPPATAGPMTTSFNVEQPPRRMASNQLRNLAAPAEDQVPMTAALGGRFGGRFPGRLSDDEDSTSAPTRVISGGLTLGAMVAGTSSTSSADKGSSKADGASTWRRGSAAAPIARTVSPSVKITPPPVDRVSPPLVAAAPKARPSPLSFNLNAAAFVPAVALTDNHDAAQTTEESSSGSEGSEHSSPVTSEENVHSRPPPSPREEASKKLYEGLGIGRPVPSTSPVPVIPSTAVQRFSQAVRMPRGPPSGADELGPKNFATRIRRKAIGGLGSLLESRERREIVEAY